MSVVDSDGFERDVEGEARLFAEHDWWLMGQAREQLRQRRGEEARMAAAGRKLTVKWGL